MNPTLLPNTRTVSVSTPNGRLRIKRPTCIGAFYTLYVPAFGVRVVANCIDATPEGRPKRMRIQRSLTHGGDVLQPHQYEIMEENTLFED